LEAVKRTPKALLDKLKEKGIKVSVGSGKPEIRP